MSFTFELGIVGSLGLFGPLGRGSGDQSRGRTEREIDCGHDKMSEGRRHGQCKMGHEAGRTSERCLGLCGMGVESGALSEGDG